MVSIIIPTLDEAGCIEEQVVRCLCLHPRPEVIVVDGGSADGTPILAARAGARIAVSSRRGRAPQMNEAAAVASGDVLLFLHADVKLPRRAYAALLGALEEPDLIGGAFRRRFDSLSLALRIGCRVADLRGWWLGVYLGDQAIFARREAFRRLGGFPDILLFEDVAFSRRLARLGRTRLIQEPVLASSRRFNRDGALRRLACDVGLAVLYALGVHPDRLARRYYPEYYLHGGRGVDVSPLSREGAPSPQRTIS